MIETKRWVRELRKTGLVMVVVATATGFALGQVGLVDFDGTTTGLTSYNNDALVGGGLSTDGNLAFNENYALFASSGDAFNPMSRASLSPFETDLQQVGMGFNISDDSVTAATGNSVFPTDTLGFAGQAKTDGFFGITDNVNSSNPTGTNTADFVFNISGFTNLSMSLDFAAMGTFLSSDTFLVSYDIDGGGFSPAFTGAAVAGANQNYVMDSTAPVVLADPYSINGTNLDDNFQTLVANLAGSGSVLTVRATGSFDGSKAIGFDNLTIRGVPEPSSLSLLAIVGLAALSRRRRM
jgi:hypothetical protein